MMKTTGIKLLAVSFLIIGYTKVSFSQCEGNQSELDAIKTKYESKFKNIENRAQEIKDDAPSPDNDVEAGAQVDIEIEMKEQHFALDLISVTMKDKKIAFDLPQVTMESKSIKFDEVYTKMVLKKTGQYPQVRCKDTWVYGPFGSKTKGVPECKTIWKDILMDVPELHTRTIEVKTDLPQFKMVTTEFITALPEFKMVRQDFVMNLPSVIVKDIKAETKKMQEDSEELQNYSQDLVGEQKKEFANAISNNFQCQRENLLLKREELSASFTSSIMEIDSNIKQLKENGFDPSNLKSSDGASIDLFELKAQLAEKEMIALKSIDNAIEELNKSEKETIEKYFSEA